MSTKMLEAQRARCIFPGSCDTNLWTRESQLMNACAKSIKAYQEIRDLTDYYNHKLAGGNIPCVTIHVIYTYFIRLPSLYG